VPAMRLTPPVPDTRGGGVSGNWEYCIVVGWDAGAAAMRFRGFRGRGQASRVPWLYGAVWLGGAY